MRDYDLLARELIRALRGRRSQAHLSRKLGYRSNVVFDWEAGRRFPTAAAALGVAARTGVDTCAALERFARPPGGWPRSIDPGTRDGVVRLLNDLRGAGSILTLSGLTGASRFTIGRWLSGRTEPRLPEFLKLVEVSTLRLADFVAALVSPSAVPSIADEWARLDQARRVAYDAPWSHAVLRVLELDEHQRLRKHHAGDIADRLGIPRKEVERCLDLLVGFGQVRIVDGRFVPDETRTVDTRYDPVRSRELRAFWTRVAADRLVAGADGEFAFNLFGVSSVDLERLRNLQRAYFRELRSIVAESQPVEHVVLTNIHLLPLASVPSPRPETSRRRARGG